MQGSGKKGVKVNFGVKEKRPWDSCLCPAFGRVRWKAPALGKGCVGVLRKTGGHNQGQPWPQVSVRTVPELPVCCVIKFYKIVFGVPDALLKY